MEPEHLALLPLWYAVFLLSITCHEAAHAWAAWQGGDPTAYRAGQVTLNPLPHIRREPMGTVVMPLLSFALMGFTIGWASAPYDPSWEERHPRRASLMALAGPMANLLLAVAGFCLMRFGLDAGMSSVLGHGSEAELGGEAGTMGAPWAGLVQLASVLLSLNLLLFLFNLLPVPPLDGAAILAGLFAPYRRLRDWMKGSSVASLAGIVLAWIVIREVYDPVLGWVVLQMLP